MHGVGIAFERWKKFLLVLTGRRICSARENDQDIVLRESTVA